MNYQFIFQIVSNKKIELQNRNGQGAKIVTDDGSRYIYAFLPSGNSRVDDVDDLEFLFVVSITISKTHPEMKKQAQHLSRHCHECHMILKPHYIYTFPGIQKPM